MPDAINESGARVDLSSRFSQSKTVVASPAAAAETIICQTPALGDVAKNVGVILFGWCAFTVGTSGANVNLRVRQTNVGGAVIDTTGNMTGGIAAGNLVSFDIQTFDASPVLPGQVYVLTLQVGSAAAASTVSACNLFAILV